METKELKFILKLLGCQNYRTSLSDKAFNSFKDKRSICLTLGDRELIDYTREIASVKILPAGRALLKLDASELPISEKELKVLEKVGKTSAKTQISEITKLVKTTGERDRILKSLCDRGLIEAESQMARTKTEVWLTARGLEHLRDDFMPKKGANPAISLDMLKNYLAFLRKSLAVETQPQLTHQAGDKPGDEEILQTIKDLDRELGTENYLPIFHLRQKLQPPLSREELDKALYRLQRIDKIELSTIVHSQNYTQDQLNAGIQQLVGNPLFFIQAM